MTYDVGLGQYAATILRRWSLVALVAVFGAVVAMGYLRAFPPQTTATTVLNVNVISTEPFNAQRSAGVLLDPDTEASIAQSYAVAEIAARDLGGAPSAAEIKEGAEVEVTAESSIVRVHYTAPDEREAVRVSDAVARAYLSYRQQQAELRIQASLQRIEERLTDARLRLDGTEGEQVGIELQDLVGQKTSLETVDTTGGAVLTSAANNPTSVAPNRAVTVLVGALVGLVIGMVAALIADRVDPRVRSAGDLRRLTDRPVVAVPAVQLPPPPELADRLRYAREVVAPDPHAPRRILIVDAATVGDGQVSDGAVALALALAQGRDGDSLVIMPQLSAPRRAQLTRSLWLESESSTIDGVPAYTSEADPGLALVQPSDTADESQADLLITKQVRRALDRPDARALLVLNAAAPRASLLAALRVCDAVLICAARNATPTKSVRDVLAGAALTETPLAGSIITTKRPGRPQQGADD